MSSMKPSLDAEIRDRVARYLNRAISLREFEEWFVPRTWNATSRVGRSTSDLINEIELRLAEYTSGHWTQRELREQLRSVIERPKTRAS